MERPLFKMTRVLIIFIVDGLLITGNVARCNVFRQGREASTPARKSEMKALCRYVGYYRVSTKRQGESGLELEAQQAAVVAYLPGRGELVRAFAEVESGKKDDRPELQKALAYATAINRTLVIAKFGRLSRDAHFLFGLQKARVKFVACDMPDATELTIGILVLVAQNEREATGAAPRPL